jgi:hypothetical protein
MLGGLVEGREGQVSFGSISARTRGKGCSAGRYGTAPANCSVMLDGAGARSGTEGDEVQARIVELSPWARAPRPGETAFQTD